MLTGGKVVALSGGVGGARFLRGLAAVLQPQELTAIVNTGDDFEHWGLYICPDLDTVMYTLAGLSHEERGWGLSEESFVALEMMRRYGETDWFSLGDRDLGTHLARTQALRSGATLSEVTGRLCRALGVSVNVLPMADGPCRTLVETDEGVLGFQHWFVRRRSEPTARAIRFDGDAAATSAVLLALEQAELVLIGPSNPYVSIDPILSRPGVRAALRGKTVVAVSPIVNGQAVKGPLAGMIQALRGVAPTAAAIADHYGSEISGLVLERGDEAEIKSLPVLPTQTVMRTRDDAARFAREVLSFAAELKR
jgi:LPPG:FO 2-phospho-L-lactate transferase